VWTDGKMVCQAQNAFPVIFKPKPAPISTSKAVPLKPEVKEGLKPTIENLKEQGY